MYNRVPKRSPIQYLALLCLVTVIGSSTAFAEADKILAPRASINQHGDFVMLGNTMGWDCGATGSSPIVGTIGSCGINLIDTAPDILWRSDDVNGLAVASNAVTPNLARSSSVLSLPPGSTVTHAYIYWAGQLVGAARATTNLRAVEKLAKEGKFKPANIVVTETHPQGMLALKSGKIDAYSTDRSLLEGLRMKSPNPDKWMTVPFAIAYEPYAYIMREGQSDFRDFVNNTILWSIHTGKFDELYEKWMGPKGVVPIPMSEAYKQYLQMMVYPISDGWWKK